MDILPKQLMHLSLFALVAGCALANGLGAQDHPAVARALSAVENHLQRLRPRVAALAEKAAPLPVLGITGTGGAGKSSLMDELVRRFLRGRGRGPCPGGP